VACCEACHFRHEERHALPYLGELDRLRMLHEHAVIESMPQGAERRCALLAHAAWEQEAFRRLLPPGLMARYTAAHLEALPELGPLLIPPFWSLWGGPWEHGAAFGFCC
jgi:hypothetical protein